MSAARLPDGLDRWRDSLHAVDRSPGEEWRSRLVHHGFRVLCVLLLAALLPFLFPRTSAPGLEDLEEGAVATRDIIAQIPFTVYKSEEQLTSERREAEQAVAPIFTFDPAAADTAVGRVEELFARLDSAVAAVDDGTGTEAAGSDTAAVSRMLQAYGVPHSAEQRRVMAEAGTRAALRRALESVFRTELSRGVAPTLDLEQVSSGNIQLRGEEGDRVVFRDSIRTVGRFFADAASDPPAGLSSPARQLFQTLLVRFVEPSVRFDRDATRDARAQARSAVEASAGYVLQGERIITAHERIGKTEVEKLEAYRARLVEEGIVGGTAGFWRGLGSFLFGVALLGLVGAVLYLFRRELYQDLRDFSLVFGLAAVVLAVAGVIGETGSPAALIPVAFAALLIGALYDGLLALVVVAALSVLLAGQAPFTGLTTPYLTLLAGATAALAIREVRRRSQSWILIAAITGAYLVGGVSLLLLDVSDLGELLRVVAWGGVNATACTALAMGAVLPGLEKLTGHTTEQTLLELADLNQPLLRRLSREAPGTYAHSISLAHLAEAAAVAIGADAVLVRVGTYYHDIGKMAGPQYFIENQPKGMNPHDRLPAVRSAELIRNHVRQGLKLAEEAGLPRLIKDFIREHHGTQKIVYFLAKAKREEPEADLDPGLFCYLGPKPQSRETAIVMLGDAVESASRTVSEPTPERIRELVDRLVDARIEDGQLDQCPLTLRDLDVVKHEFVRVLAGLYHHRIDYPDQRTGEREAAPGSASVPAGERQGGAAGPREGRPGGSPGGRRRADDAEVPGRPAAGRGRDVPLPFRALRERHAGDGSRGRGAPRSGRRPAGQEPSSSAG